MRKKKISNRILVCILLGTLSLTGCSGRKEPDLSNIRKIDKIEERETEREREIQKDTDAEKESVVNNTENSLRETELRQETEARDESLGSIGDLEDYTHSNDRDISDEDYYENKFLYDIGDVLGENGNYMISMLSVLKGESNYIGDFKQEISKEEAVETIDKAYNNLLNYQETELIAGVEIDYDMGNEIEAETTESSAVFWQLLPDATAKIEVNMDESGEFEPIGSRSEMCLLEDEGIYRIILYADEELTDNTYDSMLDSSVYSGTIDATLTLGNFTLSRLNDVMKYDSTKLLYGHKSTDMNTSIIVVNSDILDAEIIVFVKDGMSELIISNGLKYDNRYALKCYQMCNKHSRDFSDICSLYLEYNVMMNNDISDQVLEAFDENADDNLKSAVGWDNIKAEWKK